MTIDYTLIQATCENYGNDEIALKKRKDSLASTKSRLKKAVYAPDYNDRMTAVVAEIELINQCLAYLKPKAKPVTMYEQSDVDLLDYDQTMKGIKTIQSTLCLSQHETERPEDNPKWVRCKQIEAMLLEHKKTVKPVEDGLIRKSELLAVIEAIESTADATRDQIIERLRELL